MKRRLIAEIQPAGAEKMVIYYEANRKVNPYSVYLKWNEIGDYGLIKRSRLVNRYANLASAAFMLYEHAARHDEEGR